MRLTSPPLLAPQGWLPVLAEQREEYETAGLIIVGDFSTNQVFLHPNFIQVEGRLTIVFEGRSNAIYLGARQIIEGHVRFEGNNSVAELAGGHGLLRFGTTIYESGHLAIGRDCTFFGVIAWVHGGARLTIGENCLFSEPVHLRTSDHHSIIDLSTMEPVNFPADLQIGAHVWIGPDVTINKGVSIGDGSIIGARSLVNRPIADRELWVGNPARRVRENVSWVGSLPALREHIDELITKFDLASRS
jgi:acetyltransferase-like isoleucine patch superfamily enzyme